MSLSQDVMVAAVLLIMLLGMGAVIVDMMRNRVRIAPSAHTARAPFDSTNPALMLMHTSTLSNPATNCSIDVGGGGFDCGGGGGGI